MSTLARLNIVVDAEAAKRSLRSLESVAKRSASIIQGAFQRSMRVFSALNRQLFSLRSAFLALGSGLIIRDFIKVANTLEQVQFQMVAVTKSTTTASRILANTRKFASEVSFSFEDLIGASNRMAAQLKGNVDQVDFFLRASADVAAVTGMQVDEAASQFMRLMAGGTGAADTFRERGVLAMMGFEHGATYSLSEVEKKIKEAFENGGSVIAGVAPKMATTFAGSLSMIGDKVFELKARLMDAGVFDFLKDAADFINMQLDKSLTDLGTNAATIGQYVTNFLDDMVFYAASAFDGMVNLTRGVINFFETFRSAYNQVNDFTGGTVGSFGLIGAILFGRKGGIIGILVSTLAGVADYLSAWLSEQLANLMGFAKRALPGELLPAFGGTSLERALSLRGMEQNQIEGQVAALNSAPNAAAKNSLLSRLGIYQTDSGQFAGKEFYTGIMKEQYDYLNQAQSDFKLDAQMYRDGTLGFRNTTNKAIEKLQSEGFIPTIGGDPNMGPLKTTVDEGQSFTGGMDLYNQFMDFVSGRRASRNARAKGNYDPSVLTGGTTTGGTTGSTGTPVELTAAQLQAQLTDAVSAMIPKLKDGTLSYEEFNSKKELFTTLTQNSIPLVGQLTKEQMKEKSNLEALHAGTEKYNKMLEKLGITYQDTTSKFSEGFLKAAAMAGDTAAKTMEFGEKMYQGLENGLEQLIRTGKFNFKNFMQEMALDFSIMMAKIAMSKLTTTLFGGFFAGGGEMIPNRAYVVGERGREVFVPSTAGRMYSNDQLGGGGVVVNQSFDFRNADQFTEARLRQQAAVIQENTRQSIYQDMKDGGNVSKLSGRR